MAVTIQNLKLQFSSIQTDVFVLPPFVQKGEPFDEYEKVKEVSDGAFGHVFQAKSRSCGKLKAIKVLNAGPNKKDCILKALDEARIGMQMRHENIIDIEEVFYDGTRFFFVMDYVSPISISDLPKSKKNKLILFQQLVSAVMYLHSRGFLHRDIKLQNTGLRTIEHGVQLCLFDFGEACEQSYHSQKCVGTVFNISPEILKNYKYSESSEIWALMCFLVEFLTSKPLILHFFDSIIGLRVLDIQLKIDSLIEPPIPEVFKTDKSPFGLLMLHILGRGLAINPEKRLTLLELESFLQELLTLL